MGESFGGWENTIEKSVPKRGRSAEMYEDMLDFKIKDLEGKVVLDLGSGPGAKFAKEVEESGVHAQVVALSPDFSTEKHRELLKPSFVDTLLDQAGVKKNKEAQAVAATGENLPFKDESFDEVLALYSVSIYSEKDAGWVKEVCRVLKDGGILRAGPFPFGQSDLSQNNELILLLEGLGCEYTFIKTLGFEKTKHSNDDWDDTLTALILKKVKKSTNRA